MCGGKRILGMWLSFQVFSLYASKSVNHIMRTAGPAYSSEAYWAKLTNCGVWNNGCYHVFQYMSYHICIYK